MNLTTETIDNVTYLTLTPAEANVSYTFVPDEHGQDPYLLEVRTEGRAIWASNWTNPNKDEMPSVPDDVLAAVQSFYNPEPN